MGFGTLAKTGLSNPAENSQVPSNCWFGFVLWGVDPLVLRVNVKPPTGTPPGSKPPRGKLKESLAETRKGPWLGEPEGHGILSGATVTKLSLAGCNAMAALATALHQNVWFRSDGLEPFNFNHRDSHRETGNFIV